jgi:peroxiredoxin
MRTLLPLAMLLMGTSLPTLAVGPGVVVPGQPVPDFALKSAAGDNLRLSEWRGEVVLLSFWAAWCGRCGDQLQELTRLQKEYAGRGVRIVTVNIDSDASVSREATARRPDLLVLHDGDQSVARQYELANLPLTVLVDPHGKVRYVHEKYRGGDAALYDEELTALLQE